jgi:hypothetical protein
MERITLRQGNQPQANATGQVETLVARISLSVSWSSGDVYLVGKLPHGAIPLGAVFYAGAASGAALIAKAGTSESASLFLASLTYSNTGMSGAIPAGNIAKKLGTLQQISLSDDAMPRFANVTFTPTVNVSVGHVGDLVVSYKMPGQNP